MGLATEDGKSGQKVSQKLAKDIYIYKKKGRVHGSDFIQRSMLSPTSSNQECKVHFFLR